MALHPQTLPPVPEATAAAVRAAFPKGNLYVDLRAEFGALYDDRLFADLYPPAGRPVEVAPWRLALVMIMQYSRYLGLARTHLQQLLTATAMTMVRVTAWLWGEPLGERRRQPGHFAQLAPHSLSRQTVLG
jgi:hypothetical protein